MHSNYFCGKIHFAEDGFQKVAKVHISACKLNWIGLPNESTKPSAASNNSLAPALNYINA